jgi:hypothetical protein
MAELVFISLMVSLNNLHYSLNLQVFLGSIFPILTFDIIPADDIFDYMFKVSTFRDDPLSKNLD